MSQTMALLFVGITILVLFLLLLATIHYVPKALESDPDEGEDAHGSESRAA